MGVNQDANRSRKTRKPYAQRYPGGAFRLGLARRFYKSKQRGQELVEFTIVLPLLLIVVIGVMDLGRVFHASITVANASRAGARYAASFGYEDNGNTVAPKKDEIRGRVIQEAENSGITLDPLLIDIECSPISCNKGTGSIIVTVTNKFPLLLNSIIGTGIDMTHSTEMKIPW